MPTARASPSEAELRDLPSWLYVLGWDLSDVGGVNEVVKNMFDRTARYFGHRPIMFVRKWGQTEPITEVQDGRLTITGEIRSPWDTRRPLINLLVYTLSLPWALRRLLTVVRKQRIKMIHVHFPDLHALTWILVSRLAGRDTRVIVSFHGLDLKSALAARGLARAAWRLLLQAADCTFVCSEELRQQLLADYRFDSSRVCVIGNGVDVDLVQRARIEAPAIALPRSFIMGLGTYEPKKGHDVLIAAFDRAASRLPALDLVIVGRYSVDEYDRLCRLKQSVAARERIFLLKEMTHPEAMRVLARAEVFALPSRVEPFGIVLLEAGVLSRPVVATNVCGAARLFAPNAELLIVPPDDVDALSEALVRLCQDRQFATDLALRLHTRVVAEFDWEKIMECYRGRLASSASNSQVRYIKDSQG
jgi:glycosyltransferase involved in cell wall biosynthesis